MREEWQPIEYNPRYEVSNLGRIRKLNKKGYRYLKPYRKWKRQLYVIQIGKREYSVARLVANAFVKRLEPGDVVYHKNKLEFDNFYRNIQVMSKEQCGRRTGGISKSKSVVLLKGGEIKRIWKSARKAEKDLYISRQTICDYCNNRVQKKMYNLMWEDDYFDKVFEKFSWEYKRK